MTDVDFFNKIKNDVIKDMIDTGILASLTAAQAFIESNKGNSGLTQKANNLFGMKGTYQGSYITMKTKEYINGQYVVVDAKFRKYPDWLTSIRDHSNLFLHLQRYENLRGETDYIKACVNVQSDGYATSPLYSDTLIRTIEKYKLNEWDKMKPEPEDEELKNAIDVIANRVINGKFGNGHDLRASSIYILVRKRVNELLS